MLDIKPLLFMFISKSAREYWVLSQYFLTIMNDPGCLDSGKKRIIILRFLQCGSVGGLVQTKPEEPCNTNSKERMSSNCAINILGKLHGNRDVNYSKNESFAKKTKNPTTIPRKIAADNP